MVLVLAALATIRARRTAPKAADLVIGVDTGHGKEEGSDSDGKLDHHGIGCKAEQEIDCLVLLVTIGVSTSVKYCKGCLPPLHEGK
jgi:hypothetical protein